MNKKFVTDEEKYDKFMNSLKAGLADKVPDEKKKEFMEDFSKFDGEVLKGFHDFVKELNSDEGFMKKVNETFNDTEVDVKSISKTIDFIAENDLINKFNSFFNFNGKNSESSVVTSYEFIKKFGKIKGMKDKKTSAKWLERFCEVGIIIELINPYTVNPKVDKENFPKALYDKPGLEEYWLKHMGFDKKDNTAHKFVFTPHLYHIMKWLFSMYKDYKKTMDKKKGVEENMKIFGKLYTDVFHSLGLMEFMRYQSNKFKVEEKNKVELTGLPEIKDRASYTIAFIKLLNDYLKLINFDDMKEISKIYTDSFLELINPIYKYEAEALDIKIK